MIFRLLILLSSFIFSDYLGGYSGPNFRYSTNARDMSLGGALMSEYNQGFNAFSNPALLSKVEKLEIGLSYFPMSLDRGFQRKTGEQTKIQARISEPKSWKPTKKKTDKDNKELCTLKRYHFSLKP